MQKQNPSKYQIFNSCNVCGYGKIKKFLSLGKHTPADSFVDKKNINLRLTEIDLECFFCKKCFNIQLKKTINQNLKYNKVDYSYSSSNSQKSRKYLNEYANQIKKNLKLKENKILEIGANDGYLIKRLSKNNILYSCDISTYWSNKLKKEKINSINKPFEKLSRIFLKKNKNSFDTIIANNVVNHSHDLKKFFKNLYSLINEDGKIFIEVPYSQWMIENKKFELIYLEHINYFNTKTFQKICDNLNLSINKIMFTNYHGKMIRIVISKKKTIVINKKILLKEKIFFENKKNLDKFKKNIYLRKKRFLKKINHLKKKQNKIVAIGASAKTSSLLNFFNLNKDNISFVTDSSKFKIGKFIPNKKIPIKSDNALKKINNIYVFFSTWNISDFVKKKILKINKNIKIISY